MGNQNRINEEDVARWAGLCHKPWEPCPTCDSGDVEIREGYKSVVIKGICEDCRKIVPLAQLDLNCGVCDRCAMGK